MKTKLTGIFLIVTLLINSFVFIFGFVEPIKADFGDTIDMISCPPGGSHFGLAWDGECLWNYEADNEILFRILPDPSPGTIVQQIENVKINGGLTWDGEYLYSTMQNANDFTTIKQIDTNTGLITTLYELNQIPKETQILGIACDRNVDNYFWLSACEYGKNIYKIFKLKKSNGYVLDSYEVSNDIGVASFIEFDGKNLWIAESNSDKVRIYKFNPEKKIIIKSFKVNYRFAKGIAWDGENIWNVCGDSRRIYKYDITYDHIIKSFDSPGPRPVGLTWDYHYNRLWVVDQKDGLLYRINPETGVNDKYIPYRGQMPTGIAWNSGKLYVADSADDKIYLIDNSNGDILGNFSSIGPNPTGLDWDIYLEVFWGADSTDGKIYKLDEEGNKLGEIVLKPPFNNPAGIASDKKYIIYTDSVECKIIKIDKFTGEIIPGKGIYDSPGSWPWGVVIDYGYLWHGEITSEEIYKMDVDIKNPRDRKSENSRVTNFLNNGILARLLQNSPFLRFLAYFFHTNIQNNNQVSIEEAFEVANEKLMRNYVEGVIGVSCVGKDTKKIRVYIEKEEHSKNIPKYIEGYETETFVTGKIRALGTSVQGSSTSSMPPPTGPRFDYWEKSVGGLAINGDKDRNYYGTLGVVTSPNRHITDPTHYILTCNHVIAMDHRGNQVLPPYSKIKIYQPPRAPFSGWHVIGSLYKYEEIRLNSFSILKPNYIDAAIAKLSSWQGAEYNRLLDRNNKDTYEVTYTCVVPPESDPPNYTYVKKSGATSGVKENILLDKSANLNITYFDGPLIDKWAHFNDQIIVSQPFCEGGDSGSIVTYYDENEDKHNFVGILYAASDEVAVVCKASYIISDLELNAKSHSRER